MKPVTVLLAAVLTMHLSAVSEIVRDCVEEAQRRAKARGARAAQSC